MPSSQFTQEQETAIEILRRAVATAEILYLSEQLELAIIAEAKYRLQEEKKLADADPTSPSETDPMLQISDADPNSNGPSEQLD
jgi:hypothetical protein